METIKFLMDNILLWIVISIFCANCMSVMMGDPGSSINILVIVYCVTNYNISYNNIF
jgi:hypothetical protein